MENRDSGITPFTTTAELREAREYISLAAASAEWHRQMMAAVAIRRAFATAEAHVAALDAVPRAEADAALRERYDERVRLQLEGKATIEAQAATIRNLEAAAVERGVRNETPLPEGAFDAFDPPERGVRETPEGPFSWEFITASEHPHYRISDGDDNRVATCYLDEHALLVVRALNNLVRGTTGERGVRETTDLIVTDDEVNTYSSHYHIAYDDDRNVPARGREAIRAGIAAVLAQRQLRAVVSTARSGRAAPNGGTDGS